MSAKANLRAQIKAKFRGRCAYCGCLLGDKWHVDHVNPVLRNGKGMQWPDRDTFENMVPACIVCNNFKMVFSIEEFRRQLQLQVSRGRERSINFRMAEKFGQIAITETPIIFWFEKFEVPSSAESV